MAKIVAPKEQMSPTPCVGWPIQWIEDPHRPDAQGEPQVFAAQCTEVEGPGRVTLVVKQPIGQPFDRRGCLHIDDKGWEDRRPGDLNNGAWQYMPGMENPDKFKLARAFLKKQADQRKRADQRREAAEAALAEKMASRAMADETEEVPAETTS